MAEDIRILTTMAHHPKLQRLNRKLGGNGCWHFIKLLLWVADNKPDGNLEGVSDEDLELATGWSGPVSLIVSLREFHLLDGGPGSSAVHDWDVHQPWVVTRAERVKIARAAASARWTKTSPEERSAVGKKMNRARWHDRARDDSQESDASDVPTECTDNPSEIRATGTHYPCPPPNPTSQGPDRYNPDPTVGRKDRDMSPENGDVPPLTGGPDAHSVSNTNSENCEMIEKLGPRELKGLKKTLERTMRDRRIPAAFRESTRQRLNCVVSLLNRTG